MGSLQSSPVVEGSGHLNHHNHHHNHHHDHHHHIHHHNHKKALLCLICSAWANGWSPSFVSYFKHFEMVVLLEGNHKAIKDFDAVSLL